MSNGRTHLTAIYHTQHILSDLNFMLQLQYFFFLWWSPIWFIKVHYVVFNLIYVRNGKQKNKITLIFYNKNSNVKRQVGHTFTTVSVILWLRNLSILNNDSKIKKKRGWFKSYNWIYTIKVSTSLIYKTVVLFSMINTALNDYTSYCKHVFEKAILYFGDFLTSFSNYFSVQR